MPWGFHLDTGNVDPPSARRILYTAWDMQPFAKIAGCSGSPFRWDDMIDGSCSMCELDAAYFRLYGIERRDIDYVMETFPIVKRRDEEQHGEYRTKRVILGGCYDALADAIRYRPDLLRNPSQSAARGPERGPSGELRRRAFDPTFPVSPRDQILCGAILDLVMAEPGLPEMAYVDALGLLTVPKTCEKLLHDLDQRSWRSLVKKAPGELSGTGGTIPWSPDPPNTRGQRIASSPWQCWLGRGAAPTGCPTRLPEAGQQAHCVGGKGCAVAPRPPRRCWLTATPGSPNATRWHVTDAGKDLATRDAMATESTLQVDVKRLEPLVWISRLLIVGSTEPLEVIQSIPLHRGLNIVWSTDTDRGDSGSASVMTGHGVGKTTFCRLLRYCLGESTFGQKLLGQPVRCRVSQGHGSRGDPFKRGAVGCRPPVGPDPQFLCTAGRDGRATLIGSALTADVAGTSSGT